MFNVGDFVICKTSEYRITNDTTLCIVGNVEDAERNGHMFVFALEGDKITTTGIGNKDFDMEYFDFKNMSAHVDYYQVEERSFKQITLEEWNQFKSENEHRVTFDKNAYYDKIVEYLNKKKGESNMTTTIEVPNTPVISTNLGEYNFTDAQKEKCISTMKKILDEYNHANSRDGLNTIWNEYTANKAGLAYLLSMHPNWDENVMGIVLENNYNRVTDEDAIKDFAKWLRLKLYKWCEERVYKVNGCTIDELIKSYRRLKNIYEKMIDLAYDYRKGMYPSKVTYEGMTLEEVKIEYERIASLLEEAKGGATYYGCDYYYLSRDNYDKAMYCDWFIDLICHYTNVEATEDFANSANERAKPFDKEKNGKIISLKAVAGQKTSRIVNKFFKNYGFDKIVEMRDVSYTDDHGVLHQVQKDFGWNKQFALYADAITPLEVKKWTIISVNPVDYLTMSFGNGWASCHTPDKENKRKAEGNYSGCYCSGTLSYMLDNSTLIMYTVRNEYKGREFCLEDKMNRCTFHIGNDKMVQGRVYPDGRKADAETSISGQMRAIMQKVIAECVNEANLWKVIKGTRICGDYTNSRGTHYRDYLHYNDCTISFLKRNGIMRNEDNIRIGHNPICPNCGEEHDNESILICNDCDNSGSYRECVRCGCRIDIENGDYVYDEDTGDYYCDSDCAFAYDCYYCENVNEYHSQDVYYDDYTGDYFYDDGCSDCVHISDFHYLNEEHAEMDGWVYIRDEWYRTGDSNIIECPHCGAWTFADEDECVECGESIREDEEEIA